MEQVHNRQNDTVRYKGSLHFRLRQAPSKSACGNGLGKICTNGKTHPWFVDEGVKITQDGYRQDILEVMVLPTAKQYFGNAQWMFQQDSPSAPHIGQRTCMRGARPIFQNPLRLRKGHRSSGSESDGLQRMVYFGGQSLCQVSPQPGFPEGVFASGVKRTASG